MEVLKEHRKIKVSLLKNNNGQFIDIGIPKNPRVINKDNFELLVDSLKESDLTQIRPLDVLQHGDDYVVLSGNQRLRAAKALKIKEIPCNVLKDDLEPKIYRQIVMQANTNYGEWNHEDLANEWSEDELEMWGYDVPEMDEEELAPVDDVPESAPAITVKGDLYLLGEHRLLCGDSTMIDDVEKLMDGEKADITFTSPPYNAGKTPNGNNQKYLNNSDNISQSDYRSFLNEFTSNCLLKSDYVFSNIQSLSGNKVALIEHLYHMRNVFCDTIIWDKKISEPAMARKVLNSQFEYIHIFSNDAKRTIGVKDFRGTISNVFELNSRQGKDYAKIHKATFPVQFPEYFLKHFTESSCLDPFCGTGSTLIACEKTNRKCYGMELDEKYCDVIVKRYIEFCVKNNKQAKVYRNGELISNDVFLVG
jgi:ParB family chromosome partitioning protein